MKILLFISFLSLSLVSSAKVENWKGFLELLEKDKLRVYEIDKGLNELKNDGIVFPTAIHSSFQEYCETTLGFKTKYKILDYCFTMVNDSNQEIWCQLNVLSLRRKVVYCSLMISTDTMFKVINDKKSFDDLLKAHNKNFKIMADTSHLYYNPLYRCVVNTGYECEGGELIDIIWKLIKNKNKEELMKWCHSLSPEIRCYGAIGFLSLQTNGLSLNKEEIRVLDLIKNDKTWINYCDGCDGVGCITIKELIKNYLKELNEIE